MNDLQELQYNSTLSSLPLHAASLQLDDHCWRISQLFEESQDLTGILLFDQGVFKAMISRQHFLEIMNMPYSKDLFSKRKIIKIAQQLNPVPMIFKAETYIGKAVEQSLSRPADQLSEPLVVTHNNIYFTLDVHVLLRAHAMIFSATVKKLNAEILHSNLLREKLEHANREAEEIARLDSLTGIANRRHMDEYLSREWEHALSHQLPLSIILIDIDHFKSFNDRYGHQSGDAALTRVAQCLSHQIHRPADMVARYGGEEFLIILPNTTAEGALTLAEKMRQAVLHLQIPHADSRVENLLTVSCGVSSTIPQSNCSPDRVIHCSDKALYEAKLQGRNTVIVKPHQVRPAQAE